MTDVTYRELKTLIECPNKHLLSKINNKEIDSLKYKMTIVCIDAVVRRINREPSTGSEGLEQILACRKQAIESLVSSDREFADDFEFPLASSKQYVYAEFARQVVGDTIHGVTAHGDLLIIRCATKEHCEMVNEYVSSIRSPLLHEMAKASVSQYSGNTALVTVQYSDYKYTPKDTPEIYTTRFSEKLSIKTTVVPNYPSRKAAENYVRVALDILRACQRKPVYFPRNRVNCVRCEYVKGCRYDY